MRRRSFFALVALVALATAATAADIQVGYGVDAKILKKSTPAGTPLSFQLFTDSTCTTSAGAPQVANVERVTLIDQPKLIKVKGGPTPPRSASRSPGSRRLRVVLIHRAVVNVADVGAQLSGVRLGTEPAPSLRARRKTGRNSFPIGPGSVD